MSANEQRIRELAYQIWESEGCPDGDHHRHWEMACTLASAELAPAPAKSSRKPATKPTEATAAKPKTTRTRTAKAASSAEAGSADVEKKPRAPRKKKES